MIPLQERMSPQHQGKRRFHQPRENLRRRLGTERHLPPRRQVHPRQEGQKELVHLEGRIRLECGRLARQINKETARLLIF